MSFRFEITEVFPARRPIVILGGWLREGHVKMFEKIAVPYRDGSTFLCAVVDFGVPLHEKVEYVSAEEFKQKIGIAVTGLNGLEVKIDSIAIGSAAVDVQSALLKQSTKADDGQHTQN